jgi:FtsZ-binding cell division protein ZapB
MSQQLVMPEIQAAIDNLQASITKTEKEHEQLAETRKQKKVQIREWKKALRTLTGKEK